MFLLATQDSYSPARRRPKPLVNRPRPNRPRKHPNSLRRHFASRASRGSYHSEDDAYSQHRSATRSCTHSIPAPPSAVSSSLPPEPTEAPSPPFLDGDNLSSPSLPPSSPSSSSTPSSIVKNMSARSEYPTLDHPNPSKLPILTEGILTPDVASELGCLDYFGIKDTASGKQVSLAVASMRDGHMHDGISSDRDRLKALSFGDLLTLSLRPPSPKQERNRE